MVPATAHDPSDTESRKRLFSENVVSGLSPEALIDVAALSRPISTDDYMQQVKIAFDAFAESLPDDFIPATLPADYLQTCNVEFTPSAARIIQHNLANALNAVLAYNPDIDFRENERDMVKPNGAQENEMMAKLLVESFQQFGKSFHEMREAASLRSDADILLSHFDLFGQEMMHLTQRFSAGNETLSQLPQTLQAPVNQNEPPSLHAGIKQRMMHLN